MDFPMSCSMEAMTKISYLTKRIVFTHVAQQQVTNQVIQLQEKFENKYLNISEIHDKSKKAIESGETV